MQHFGLTLGQAKQAVSIHPSWSTTVRMNESLHEEAIAAPGIKDEKQK